MRHETNLLLGPILFASVPTAQTFIEYDFLISLDWLPINDQTFDCPSGLALGGAYDVIGAHRGREKTFVQIIAAEDVDAFAVHPHVVWLFASIL
ncbi:MAG: hypothetical protein Q8O48_05480 [Anaerolineales bacterium]|nr:hypothetical protein [Anaerolineales bacterium]